jgi:hypothetical protein
VEGGGHDSEADKERMGRREGEEELEGEREGG